VVVAPRAVGSQAGGLSWDFIYKVLEAKEICAPNMCYNYVQIATLELYFGSELQAHKLVRHKVEFMDLVVLVFKSLICAPIIFCGQSDASSCNLFRSLPAVN